ncbi:hypothetical protein M5D96_002963 [Drosophila gunungcola]|uniref:Uncharacterized protein n=1 Tax=Drosophila gunungcola TaxID=103775 RepID=A0A9P9Z0X0_9MUSC|nr:hypothetical protein M5D96_002963 [Drosophila gunungcola]
MASDRAWARKVGLYMGLSMGLGMGMGKNSTLWKLNATVPAKACAIVLIIANGRGEIRSHSTPLLSTTLHSPRLIQPRMVAQSLPARNGVAQSNKGGMEMEVL